MRWITADCLQIGAEPRCFGARPLRIGCQGGQLAGVCGFCLLQGIGIGPRPRIGLYGFQTRSVALATKERSRAESAHQCEHHGNLRGMPAVPGREGGGDHG